MAISNKVIDKIRRIAKEVDSSIVFDLEEDSSDEASAESSKKPEEEGSPKEESGPRKLDKNEIISIYFDVRSAKEGLNKKFGYSKEMGFFEKINHQLVALSLSKDPDILKLKMKINAPGEWDPTKLNERAALAFSNIINNKGLDFNRYFRGLMEQLIFLGIQPSRKVESTEEYVRSQEISQRYDTRRMGAGIFDPMSAVQISIEALTFINKSEEVYLGILKKYMDNVSAEDFAKAAIHDYENQKTDELQEMLDALKSLEAISAPFRKRQGFEREVRKERKVDQPYTEIEKGNGETDVSSDNSSQPKPDSLVIRDYINNSIFKVVDIDPEKSTGIIEEADGMSYSAQTIGDSIVIYIKMFLSNSDNLSDDQLKAALSTLFDRMVYEDLLVFDDNIRQNYKDIIRVEAERLSEFQNGVYMILNIDVSNLRFLGKGDEIMTIVEESDGTQRKISIASQEMSDFILKLAESQTTVYYETVDPDGNKVFFTPADLVINSGKLKSKGKTFKPKKIKGKSLADLLGLGKSPKKSKKGPKKSRR